MQYVVQGLRKASPNLRVLVIPPSEGLDPQLAAGLKIDGTVSQPFYAPDLLETLDKFTLEPKATTPVPPPATSRAPEAGHPGTSP